MIIESRPRGGAPKRERKRSIQEIQKQGEVARSLGYDLLGAPDWRDGYRFSARPWYPYPWEAGCGAWSDDALMLLVREVSLLTRNGLSERKAIERLARDAKKLALFPYTGQSSPSEKRNGKPLAGSCPHTRAAAALRRQLQQLKNDRSLPGDVRDALRRHLAGDVSAIFERAAAEAEHRRKILAGEN